MLEAEKFEKNKILSVLNNTLKLDIKYAVQKEIAIQGYYYLYHTFCRRKKCENCVFFGHGIVEDEALCFNIPPKVIWDVEKNKLDTVYPTVYKQAWCGKWKRKQWFKMA